MQRSVVVAAWGDIAHRSNLHSSRKSLLDSLIGIAVAEGKINLDELNLSVAEAAKTRKSCQSLLRRQIQPIRGW